MDEQDLCTAQPRLGSCMWSYMRRIKQVCGDWNRVRPAPSMQHSVVHKFFPTPLPGSNRLGCV